MIVKLIAETVSSLSTNNAAKGTAYAAGILATFVAMGEAENAIGRYRMTRQKKTASK